MRLGIDRGSFLIGLCLGGLLAFAGSLSSVSSAAPTKPAIKSSTVKAAIRANAIGGGTVTLPCNLTPKSIALNDDGSTAVALDREIGGGHRLRANLVSSDGTIFSVDGVPITSPPPAMVTLGNTLSQLQSRLTAAYSAPGVAAVLCAP